ncbi:E3 ubiquitin-protein ligase SMURF2-like protein [Sarcoptes scabiei]|uniref:E3 ubiquitin-protein ligase n=1 Tax=Sarcoptes scabiei TaxID=52283 RepID=A0A132AEN0_SARSC|nr:E3 ubiquitin-protein ligase SMURF2-like protein [Sarcoptes scabiei]
MIISIWNQKKIHKKHGGFLGCVKIMPNLLQSLKDAGYQRLDLHRYRADDADIIKGQIVISVISKDSIPKNSVVKNSDDVVIASIPNDLSALTGSGNNRSNEINNNGNDCNGSSDAVLLAARSYVEGVDDLPEGWTECRSSNDRVYYINHVTRTTQWERPSLPAALSNNFNQISSNSITNTPNRSTSARSSRHTIQRQHQTLLAQAHNRSYHNINHQTQGSIDSTNSVSSCNSAPAISVSQHSSRNQHQRRSTRHRNYLARNQLHEAVITALANVNNAENHPASEPPMPNGFEMRTTSQGQVYFHQTESGQSTWIDPRVPSELLNMDINLDELVGPLGCGWEVRHTNGGRRYFVDHTNRTTQFTDPRLITHSMLITNLLKSLNKNGCKNSQQSSNQNNSNNSNSNAISNNQQLVHHQNHHNNSNHHHQQSQNNNLSKSNGAKRSNHFNSSIDGNNLQTIKNGIASLPINQQQKRRNLVQKMSTLRQNLQTFQPPSGHCRIEVSREDIFEDSYRCILKLRPKDLRKRLMIKFKDEEGLDYGGIAREWLYLLSHEMLNPYYGLFQYTREDIYTLQINPDSSINPDHLSYFHFVGRVIGIAVFHGHYIDGGFTLPFYKMLLNKPITLDDIESVDPELYRSLRWILDNDITNVVDMTFSVNHDSFGEIQVKELKENGKDLAVTEQNKKEYVQLYVNFRFTNGIEQQFRALQKGFCELIPQHLLVGFDEKELELVIGGLGKIDLNDWKQHTRLKHCTSDSKIVQWFWKAVHSYSEERRARLLQFVTGSSRVPLQGSILNQLSIPTRFTFLCSFA